MTEESIRILVGRTRQGKLENLEISGNGTVMDEDVRALRKMTSLRRLRLENLAGVSDPKKVLEEIKSGLPNCNVIWPPHTEDPEKVEEGG